MRRADRLFRIVQLLRPRRLTTGAWLAERLEVSSRTIYRDIHDLQLSGVPIVGEAGVGYALSHKLDLPPRVQSKVLDGQRAEGKNRRVKVEDSERKRKLCR